MADKYANVLKDLLEENVNTAEESWEDGCSDCGCKNGTAVCVDRVCPIPTCPLGQHSYKSPGQCCSSCIPDSETCTVSATGMYHTFDQHAYQFSGGCRYTLAQDCSGGDFSIHIMEENKTIGYNAQAHRRALFINIDCITVKIKYNGNVKVGDVSVRLPYSHLSPKVVDISRRKKNKIIVKTSVGVVVEWNMIGDINLFVPRSYEEKLCGLCGNMNHNDKDDETTRQFLPARTVNEFIHSWKYDGYKHCRRYGRVSLKRGSKTYRKNRPCWDKTIPEQLEARRRCSVMVDGAFRACFKVVNVRPYYKMCLEDVCTCAYNELCYCESVMAYVHECGRNGITLRNWKDKNLCATTCPEGMVYDHCGPPCPQTCDGSESRDPVCQNQPCVPKCQCPAGLLLHEGTCISRRMCPFTASKYMISSA
ncbi:BMP-binding endothelial regulator protein-like [Glandiceps talaboti]